MNPLNEIDVVILCGGLGKRLRSEIGRSQKTMAAIRGEPFLNIWIRDLSKQGFRRIILCTGYRAESVHRYYRKNNFGVEIVYSREKNPLGTGGALGHSGPMIHSDPFFVLNGDSYCAVSFKKLLSYHHLKKSLVTIVISKVKNQKDYGSVSFHKDKRITGFKEKVDSSLKRSHASTDFYANAGIYCFRKNIFQLMPKVAIFSLEKDFFPRLLRKPVFAFKVNTPFWDIGTPYRYQYAQSVLKR